MSQQNYSAIRYNLRTRVSRPSASIGAEELAHSDEVEAQQAALDDDDEDAENPYSRYIPEIDEYTKEPPPLPPHLRHIILNKVRLFRASGIHVRIVALVLTGVSCVSCVSSLEGSLARLDLEGER